MCGCRGPLSCGQCKSVHYCNATHQKIDWTLGEHKLSCKTGNGSHRGHEKHQFLFEEFDLVTEPEVNDDESDTKQSEQEKDERRMKEYEEFIGKQQQTSTDVDLKDVPDEEFEKYVNQTDNDTAFRKFKKRTAPAPEQVRLSNLFLLITAFIDGILFLFQLFNRFFVLIEVKIHFGSPTKMPLIQKIFQHVNCANLPEFLNFK